MKIITTLQVLMVLGTVLSGLSSVAWGDQNPSAQFMVRFEVRRCFYVSSPPQLSCRSERPDYSPVTIELQPNTVPNPYGASGWSGSWEGNVSEHDSNFFASIQVSVERVGEKVGGLSRYVIVSQLWKDPKQPIIQEVVMDNLSQIPEISIMGISETATDGNIYQPRLSLKSIDAQGVTP